MAPSSPSRSSPPPPKPCFRPVSPTSSGGTTKTSTPSSSSKFRSIAAMPFPSAATCATPFLPRSRTSSPAKGVPTPSVTSLPSASRPGHPLDSIAFSIASPQVLVHSLTLVQPSPDMQPKLQRTIADLTNQQWDQSTEFDAIDARVGDLYHNERHRIGRAS